ncbi:MAG: crotonase/enoyl-CoA hydratase family protein [Deltaproteobacteria bacterium]|nr:crotonase/enoyl-CoA hydratase family protein [Deltaproteobacteria bacterium]
MDYETIRMEMPEPGIGLITLNRPDQLNAWTKKMMEELIDTFCQADENDDIRVTIITGEGKGFCAGADLDPERFVGKSKSKPSDEIPRDTAGQLTLAIYDLKKPVIAAINGPAVGVGITMTLPMDIRIASTKAKMGFAFNRRGMVPEGCSTWFLPRIVGISRASEWITTGRILSSKEAFEGGLVSQVVEPDKLMPAAFDLAREIRDNTSSISTVLARQMLWRMLGADHPMEAHKLESRNLHYMFQSADLQEGVASFLEKRPPNFPMKPSRDLPDFYPWWKDRPYREE